MKGVFTTFNKCQAKKRLGLQFVYERQSDQMMRKKIRQIFQRIAQKVAKSKKGKNIYKKAQFENPKHLHQTTFKTLKYLQQTMF